MTMQSIKGTVAIPQPRLGNFESVLNNATVALDATTDRAALIFKVPNTTTISTVGFNIAAVAGPSGSMDMDVRLETVDATTGDPSGTLWATDTNAAVTINFNDDNKYIEVTLTASASVTQGQDIAIVLNPLSFTTVTSVQIIQCGVGDLREASTYTDLNNGGAGYVKNSSNIMSAAIGDGTTYYPIVGTLPWNSVTTTTFNSGSTITRRALKFQIPFKVRCIGAYIEMDFDGDTNVNLYDSDGSTVLASTSLDSSIDAITGFGVYYIRFDASVTLSINTNYYLSIEPSTVTSMSVYQWNVASPATNTLLDASPGGKNFILSTYDGTWTDTNTSQPFMGILVDQFDDGAGVGTNTKITIGASQRIQI